MFYLLPSCARVDAVRVRANIGGEVKNIGTFCGQERPSMLMSNDNNLEVSFISRTLMRHMAKGFKAEYRFVTGLLHSIQLQLHSFLVYYLVKSSVIRQTNQDLHLLKLSIAYNFKHNG